MKKGFTLIELLAVIMIMGLISILLIPNITKTNQSIRQKTYNTKVESIVKASKICEEDGLDDCDLVSLLLSKKYVTPDNGSSCSSNCLKNPIDDTYLDNCFVVGDEISCTKRAYKLVKIVKDIVEGEADTTTDVITKQAPAGATCTNTLAYDRTDDNNLRYVGANPCNYVTFNGENAGWRIIGVMNNIEDGTGKLETRIKLVRIAFIGSYSWDSSKAGEDGATGDNGVNDWSKADLMKELNGDYMDMTLTENPTNWYNGASNTHTGGFDIRKRLGKVAQNQIGDVKWKLGGYNISAPVSTFYKKERETMVIGNPAGTCNDGACPRATEWVGKVALIYPSDYGYAVGGSVRNTCLEKNLNTYTNDNCYTNDWITETNTYQWTLMPHSNYANNSFGINHVGNVSNYQSRANNSVRPAVYLKSNVVVTDGDGSKNNPYVLK